MKTLAIINHKGGVGKTTLAGNMAAWLAGQGHRVILVDTDPQGHCARLFGLPKQPGMYNTITGIMAGQANAIFDQLVEVPAERWWPTETTGALYLLPGDISTADIDAQMSVQRVTQSVPPTLLQRALAPLRGRVHFVIIDSNPTINEMTLNIIAAADYALVPTETKTLSVNGTVESIAQIGEAHNVRRIEVIGIVPNKHHKRMRQRRMHLEDLTTAYGDLVWPPLHELVTVEESADYGLSVFAYEPGGRAGREMQAVAQRALTILQAVPA